MTAKNTLRALLLLLLANGAIAGYFEARHLDLLKMLDLLFTMATVINVYLWYYLDANERQYQRNSLLGGAIVFLSVLAVPWYLFRSRPKGQKLKALLRYLGFVVLCVVVFVAGHSAVFMLFNGGPG